MSELVSPEVNIIDAKTLDISQTHAIIGEHKDPASGHTTAEITNPIVMGFAAIAAAGIYTACVVTKKFKA